MLLLLRPSEFFASEGKRVGVSWTRCALIGWTPAHARCRAAKPIHLDPPWKTLEAYLDRKHQELTLLNGFLGTPLRLRHSSEGWACAAWLGAHETLPGHIRTRLRARRSEFSCDYKRTPRSALAERTQI